jgi:hypothetical protein
VAESKAEAISVALGRGWGLIVAQGSRAYRGSETLAILTAIMLESGLDRESRGRKLLAEGRIGLPAALGMAANHDASRSTWQMAALREGGAE